MQAWFVAPDDGEYRFLLSCDDKCDLSLAHETPYIAGTTLGLDLPVAPIIIEINGWCRWRDYFNTNYEERTQKSEWFTFEKGKQYYMEGRVGDWGGADHYTVSVEVKPKDQTVL